MVNVPNKDELYPRVDQEFHQQYPDGCRDRTPHRGETIQRACSALDVLDN